jgi:hypothetical protein
MGGVQETLCVRNVRKGAGKPEVSIYQPKAPAYQDPRATSRKNFVGIQLCNRLKRKSLVTSAIAAYTPPFLRLRMRPRSVSSPTNYHAGAYAWQTQSACPRVNPRAGGNKRMRSPFRMGRSRFGAPRQGEHLSILGANPPSPGTRPAQKAQLQCHSSIRHGASRARIGSPPRTKKPPRARAF